MPLPLYKILSRLMSPPKPPSTFSDFPLILSSPLLTPDPNDSHLFFHGNLNSDRLLRYQTARHRHSRHLMPGNHRL